MGRSQVAFNRAKGRSGRGRGRGRPPPTPTTAGGRGAGGKKNAPKWRRDANDERKTKSDSNISSPSSYRVKSAVGLFEDDDDSDLALLDSAVSSQRYVVQSGIAAKLSREDDDTTMTSSLVFSVDPVETASLMAMALQTLSLSEQFRIPPHLMATLSDQNDSVKEHYLSDTCNNKHNELQHAQSEMSSPLSVPSSNLLLASEPSGGTTTTTIGYYDDTTAAWNVSVSSVTTLSSMTTPPQVTAAATRTSQQPQPQQLATTSSTAAGTAGPTTIATTTTTRQKDEDDDTTDPILAKRREQSPIIPLQEENISKKEQQQQQQHDDDDDVWLESALQTFDSTNAVESAKKAESAAAEEQDKEDGLEDWLDSVI